MLKLVNITKQYPGANKKANNNISLELKKGEILCIAGPNGAGKTTLMKILMGLETQDYGDIFLDNKKIEINSAKDAKNFGIGMVHQHFMLFGEYTAAQNIVMGKEPRKWGVFYDNEKAQGFADKIIKDNNFSVNSKAAVKNLSLGEMQQVEICRILYYNAKIIILDEPTTILTENETQALFNTIKKLVQTGKSVILITHKLKEIKQICDRVILLCNGEVTDIFEGGDIDEYKITQKITGNGKNNTGLSRTDTEEKNKNYINDDTCKTLPFQCSPVINFENVTVRRHGQKRPLLDNVSFYAEAGKILGFTGLSGNGLGVIEAVLGGFLHPAQGKIFYNGIDISKYNTMELRKLGLSYVPADRLRYGSASSATIAENAVINMRNSFSGRFVLGKKEKENFTKEIIKSYGVIGANGSLADTNEKCAFLSGGNLQKLILGREIKRLKDRKKSASEGADYIVFSEPTWGLDIASSGFVTREIDSLRKINTTVILISTNLEEVLALSDRIIVMYRGKISGEFNNTQSPELKENILKSMQGFTVNI